MPWGWLVNILNVLLRNIVFKVFSYHFRFCNGGSPRERVQPSLSPNTIYQGGTIKSFPVTQISKNLPAMQETQVQTLGWEDSLEKGMTTHSRFLAWRIHGQRTVAGYSPWGHKEADTTEQLSLSLYTHERQRLGRSSVAGLLGPQPSPQ